MFSTEIVLKLSVATSHHLLMIIKMGWEKGSRGP